MTTPPRIAIIGAGAIGAVHARLVARMDHREATLGAIIDRDITRARELGDRCGVPGYTSLAEALAACELDVAAICLPSSFHAEAAIDALRAGLHVIVEKPIDITLDAADRLMAAERSTGRTVSVISQRRFQPAASFIHRSIHRGDLGRITSATVESPFWRPQEYYTSGDWRGTAAIDGGGALMNQGIHALDLLLWMLGTPTLVMAATGQLAHDDLEVEDVAGATITFTSGAIATLVASTAAFPGRPVRLSVHGDAGTAIMEDDRLSYFTTSTGIEPTPDDVSEQQIPQHWSAVDVAHQRQYRDIIAAISRGRAPAVSTADGHRALQVVLAIYESARTGQPVTLSDALSHQTDEKES